MTPVSTTSPVIARVLSLSTGSPWIRLRQALSQFTVISLILISIVPPSIAWDATGKFYLKWEIVLLPVVLSVYLWLSLVGIARPIHLNGMFLVGVVYSISVSLSIWYGSAMLNQTVIARDFFELPKLWLPVLFFTLAYEARLSERALRRLLNFFAASIVLVCLYAWAQWAGLEFAHWLNKFYSSGENVLHSLDYARRVYSTMGNPNLLGMLMTWSVAAFLLATVLRVGNQIKNIGMLVVCLVTLTMTGSRYGLLTTAFAVVLLVASLFISGRPHFWRVAVPLALLPFFASIILMVSSSNVRTLERFQTLREPTQTDSFRQRADALWVDALDSFWQSPFLGRGPAKTAFEEIITDSEYLDVLKKFGVVGFLSYLAYYFFPLSLIWRAMGASRFADTVWEDRIPANFVVMRLGFVMLLTALVMNVGESTFYNAVLQGFFFMWIGLAVRAAQSVREASLWPSLSYASGIAR